MPSSAQTAQTAQTARPQPLAGHAGARAPAPTAAAARGPLVHRFAYFVAGRDDRPLLLHQLRDGDAAMMVLPVLLDRGFSFGGPVLNSFAGGTGWADLVPCKEGCITALSLTLRDGAAMMGRILETLIARGMSSYSLTAILAPERAAGRPSRARFNDWPAVVWRLVDRGDAMAAHSDIGCMDLFGSPVVATDPFTVAASLRRAAAKAPRPVTNRTQEPA